MPFSVVGNAAHKALNREAAGKAMCLYKNKAGLLPLLAQVSTISLVYIQLALTARPQDFRTDNSLLIVDISAGSGVNIIGNCKTCAHTCKHASTLACLSACLLICLFGFACLLMRADRC